MEAHAAGRIDLGPVPKDTPNDKVRWAPSFVLGVPCSPGERRPRPDTAGTVAAFLRWTKARGADKQPQRRREIKHPRTGEVLGRAEDALGLARITQAQEGFAVAAPPAGVEIKPGDRFRVSSGKVSIVLLPLLGSLRETLVEAATQELVERLAATGRFKVTMGDTINVFLAQQRLTAADFLA